MTAPDLIVCGSLTLDNVVTAEGRALAQSCGGNVVYAALGARLWGARVGLVSRAGNNLPRAFLEFLQALGLDLAGVRPVDAPHGMNVAFAYRPDGSRVRAFPPGLMAALPPAERHRFTDYTTRGEQHRFATWLRFAPEGVDIPTGWLQAPFMHCCAMPVQRHVSLARTVRAARPNAHIQVDSPWYDERFPALDCHTELLRTIDLLLPSEADLLAWRPGESPLSVASGLAATHGRRIVVKRGGAGSVLFDEQGRRALAVPVYDVRVLDPTGAGDAFCGGVLAGLRRFGELGRALACGTASASFAIEGEGVSRLATASRDEAEQRFTCIERRIATSEGA
jgi:ribokinase